MVQLGVPYLFWNEEPVTRFSAAVGCTLLLALLGINAYYLIPENQQVEVMDRIEAFLARRSVLKLPFGRWLEPSRGNAVELSRFLRAARFPFLMMLFLPALLPLVFPVVPRYAPVASEDLERLLNWANRHDLYDEWNRHPDVSAHVPAYLFGLAIWAAGLLTGVVVVKFAIKATSSLHPLVKRFDAFVFPPVRRVLVRLSELLRGTTNRPSAITISAAKLNSIITFFGVTILCYIAFGTVFYGNHDLGLFVYRGVAPHVPSVPFWASWRWRPPRLN